jgi:hypothetical protein
MEIEPELAPGKPLDTPRKNKVLGYIQCCEDHHIKWTKAAVSRALKVSRQQVEYAVKNPYPRTKKSSELKRGNHRKVTPEELDVVMQYLTTTDFGAERILNWNEVVAKLDLKVSGRHLHEVMKPRLRSSRTKAFKNTYKKIPTQQKQQQEQQPSPPSPSLQQQHRSYTMFPAPFLGGPQIDQLQPSPSASPQELRQLYERFPDPRFN